MENGIYHVYNRGVAKNDIFLNKEDYKTFLYYLKIYLCNPEKLKDGLRGTDPIRTERKNFHGRIELLGYCLMPNHYHLIIKQKDQEALTEFMRAIMTNYSMYFNKKYDRVGPVFQGRYKAANVNHDEQLTHLTRYIHLNPCKGPSLAKRPEDYEYSSYIDYIGKKSTEWVKPSFVLQILGTSNYTEFIESELESIQILGKLVIE